MLIHNPNGWDYRPGINGPDIRQVVGSKALTSGRDIPAGISAQNVPYGKEPFRNAIPAVFDLG